MKLNVEIISEHAVTDTDLNTIYSLQKILFVKRNTTLTELKT